MAVLSMTGQLMSNSILSAGFFNSWDVERKLASSDPQFYDRWRAKEPKKIANYEEYVKCPTLNMSTVFITSLCAATGAIELELSRR